MINHQKIATERYVRQLEIFPISSTAYPLRFCESSSLFDFAHGLLSYYKDLPLLAPDVIILERLRLGTKILMVNVQSPTVAPSNSYTVRYPL